jgi:steroid 5-alpha reductase family enzyme
MIGAWQALAAGVALCGGGMLLLWRRQCRTRDATEVDVAWAANLGLLALLYAALGSAPLQRRLLLAGFAGFWSARLAWHLLRDRVLARRGEDGRYATLRAKWGADAPRNFLVFYLAQGALDVVLSLPFLLVAFNPAPALHPLEFAGAALLVLSLAGEALADRQLAAHCRDPANRGLTCRRGLWAFSRHPNYFCEWLNWIGFALLALPAAWGWLGLLSPLLMLLSILFVTGIPPTEAQALKSRRDYADYQRTTSAFFPWPSKPGAARAPAESPP